MKYPVNDIYVTIQGEGRMVGVPMLLVRLQGCDVGCPFCDTKETWEMPNGNGKTLDVALKEKNDYTFISVAEMFKYYKENFPEYDIEWVLLTGGEPALYDLNEFVSEFHELGMKVALETSGTEAIKGQCDFVTVSPKINMPNGKPIIGQAIAAADEIKFVIGREKDIAQSVALLEAFRPDAEISFQPISESSRAVNLIKNHIFKSGGKLSIQTHKIIGVK